MSEAVRGMFNALAWRYDLGNDLLSLGLHRRWKQAVAREALRVSKPRSGFRALDCACGSGDIAFAIRNMHPDPYDDGFEVIGVDFSPEMIQVAWARESRLNDFPPYHLVRFLQGDVLDLQFKDGEFDAATIGFGIRNVDDPALCLREMARVVRPGGRVVVLETGQPNNALWRRIYNIYGHLFMEPLGALATGQREAYAYLNRTAASFPCGESFMRLMRSVELEGRPAFASVSGQPLLGGIAWLYVGVRA